MDIPRLNSATTLPLLHFQVSLNEEHICLQVQTASGRRIDMGERAHHYCLVTLARQRLHDAGRGLDPSSQGWLAVDELARMLGLDPAHLNIQIYRARQHLARALAPSDDAAMLLERRRGEVRFGALPFRIVRGSCVEGDFAPTPAPARADWEPALLVSPADVMACNAE
jgi:hypothetical protein